MKKIPVLQINEFENRESNKEFYSNDIKTHLKEYHHSIYKPHKHDFYLTVLFSQGTGIHEIDFQKHEVKPGTVFFMKPGQTHNWVLSEDVDGYIFFLSESYYNIHFTNKKIQNLPFFNALQNVQHLYLNSNNIVSFISLFSMIINTDKNKKALYSMKLIALIDLLFIDLNIEFLQNHEPLIVSNDRYYIYLIQLIRQIEFLYKTEKSPTKYAEILFISPKHLNRICQSLLNKSVQELINDRVILEAKRLLISTNTSLTFISETLGYNDYAYFSRFFKHKCKESPFYFRKRYELESVEKLKFEKKLK